MVRMSWVLHLGAIDPRLCHSEIHCTEICKIEGTRPDSRYPSFSACKWLQLLTSSRHRKNGESPERIEKMSVTRAGVDRGENGRLLIQKLSLEQGQSNQASAISGKLRKLETKPWFTFHRCSGDNGEPCAHEDQKKTVFTQQSIVSGHVENNKNNTLR
jgi:hypothetical protein